MTPLRGRCPHCFRRALNAINHSDSDRARSGDIGICRGCGGLMLFDFNYRCNVCRKPTPTEIAAILDNADYQDVRARLEQRKLAA